MSRKGGTGGGGTGGGGTGGGGWGHPQGDMHIVAARLGCQSAMVCMSPAPVLREQKGG